MKIKPTFEGRSLLFNVLFVVLNLLGLTLITLGNHKNFAESSVLLNSIGFILIALTTAGIFIFRGRLMFSSVARVLVGGLFIVSGLVKANDPIGFAYKLEEYFEDGALAYRIKELFGAPGFSLEFLIEWALFFSVLICIIEIVIGVLLIIGGKIKLTSYILVGMMLFFTFLTWHTANCDASNKFLDRDTYAMSDPVAATKLEAAKNSEEITIISQNANSFTVEEMKQPQCVNDCGCFGDALKGSVGRSLTPNESLWKDIVLLYLSLWIFISQWIIKPNNRKQNFKFSLSSLIVVAFFAWVFSWFFPILFAIVAIIAALWMTRSKILGNHYGSALVVTALCTLLVVYVLAYSPLKDYRPYAVGSVLSEKMNDGIDGVYQNLLEYKNVKTGEVKKLDAASEEYTNSKIWENEDWEYVDMVQKEIVPTKLPSITDQFNPFLTIENVTKADKKLPYVDSTLSANLETFIHLKDLEKDSAFAILHADYSEENHPDDKFEIIDTTTSLSEELTEISLRDYFANAKQLVCITSKNIAEANWSKIERYKEIFEGCKEREIPFVIICNGTIDQLERFRKENNFDVPIFLNDETELKAIARSNPSLLIIQEGTIKGKYDHRSTPTYEWLSKNLLK